MTVIGIDFGTTNSVVAHYSPSGIEVLDIDEAPIKFAPYGFDCVLPTVMANDEAGRVTFGWAAKTTARGRFDAVKRMFATQLDTAVDSEGNALAVEEVATMLFAELRQRAITRGGLPTVDAAVVTVPANSKGRARHRTKLCAGMAGLEVLALINEPTAAAMAYAQKHPEARQLLVFDWGGGTLDVTVLQSVDGVFIEQASAGLPRSGGIDFDSRVEKIVRESVPGLENLSVEDRHFLRLEAELAKIRLSEAEATTIEIPGGREFRLTRSAFEREIQPLIEESRIPIERCLKDLGLGPGAIDAVVLVGGTCKIPAIREFVRSLLQTEISSGFNPMTIVGEGAAVAAAILSGELEDSDFFVSIEHALGTFTYDPATGSQNFSTIIPRGHKLPAKLMDSFTPIVRETESINVQVVEGDPESQTPDYTVLKEWDVRLPETYEDDSSRSVNIQYEYDVDGILHVTVTDIDTSALLLEDDISYGIATDKRQLKQMSDRAKAAVQTGQVSDNAQVRLDDPEATRLISQARVKVIPFLDDSEAAIIEGLVLALEDANDAQRPAAKEALKKGLSPYSYLF